MNERIWELPASAALDRELDAEETLAAMLQQYILYQYS